MESHPEAPEQTGGFRDPTGLVKWTRGFLYAGIAAALWRIWLDGSALLAGVGEGASADTEPSLIVLALTGAPLLAITGILVLTWIHRVNQNARQLGATDMHFTPGWAVGWYFVPIAWFWKPYQAMTEIWRASRNPADWRGETVSPLLPWWWFLWIVPSWGLDIVDWAVGRSFDEADAETLEAATGLAGWILDVPLILVLLAIIGAVHRMQMEHRARQVTVG